MLTSQRSTCQSGSWKSVGGAGGIGSGKAAIWKALAGQTASCTSTTWCGLGGCYPIKGAMGNNHTPFSLTGSAQVDGSGNLYLRVAVSDAYNARYFDSGWASSQNGKATYQVKDYPNADCNPDGCTPLTIETTPTQGVYASFGGSSVPPCSVNWN